MTGYLCPRCRGGFDEPDTSDGQALACCPWCGTKMNRTYDPEEHTPVISRVTSGDSDDSDSLLGKLFR